MTNSINRRQFVGRAGAVIGSAALGPGLLSACGGGDSGGGSGGGGGTFKIGAVLELSGESATGGQIAKRGYQMWADTVNEAGGIDIDGTKHKVELIVQDCQSQPANAATAVTRLATQQKVDALFGSYTSGVQIAMNPICEKQQLPCIAGSAESPETWKSQPKFVYGMIPAVDVSSTKAIELLAKTAQPAPKSIAPVGVREPFSQDTQVGFEEGGKSAGLTIAYKTLFPANADLTPIANVIKGKKADIVAVGGHDVLLVDFVKALASANYTPKAIIEHYGVTDASFAKALGKRANGVLGITMWLPDGPGKDELFGSAKEFNDAYEKKYKTPPDYTAAGCAASGLVLQEALKAVKGKPGMDKGTRAKLNDAIAKTDIETFYGKVKFDGSGPHFHDNTALEPVLIQIQEGKPVPVAPESYKQADLVYPLEPLT